MKNHKIRPEERSSLAMRFLGDVAEGFGGVWVGGEIPDEAFEEALGWLEGKIPPDALPKALRRRSKGVRA